MDPETLKKRTKTFAFRVIPLTESPPTTQTPSVLSKQLLRCGTSVSSDYRAACRAKSKADFIHKLSIVEEEADESGHWMELLVEAGIVERKLLEPLMQEANELTAIIVASIRSAKQNRDD